MENKFDRVFNALEKTGTNWTVNKLPLVSPCGKPTESYGLFRNDNGLWLGTVGSRYCEYQNAQLAELVLEATDNLKLSVTKGGVLQNGRKVFYQIALPDAHVGNSGIKRYVTAVNSHDGSSSIGLGSTNTVIVCQNTFFRAYREVQRIKHFATASTRLKIMAENLQETIGKDDLLIQTYKRMAEVELKDEMIDRVIRAVFKTERKRKINPDLSTRTKNEIAIFGDNLRTEVSTHGLTVWSLFNAVTRFTNHHSAPQDEQRRLDYVMTGGGQQLSNLAFNELLQYIDANIEDGELVLV